MSLSSAQADLIGAFNDFLTECRTQIAPASADLAVSDLLQQVLTGQQQLLQEIKQMSDNVDGFTHEMAQLRADVAAQSTVIGSATEAFTGLAARLAAAESHATAAGATPEQIAALTAVRQDLEANTAALAAAVPQNTPAAADQGTPASTPAPAPAPAPATDAGTPAPTPAPAPAPAPDATSAAPAPTPAPDATAQPAPADAGTAPVLDAQPTPPAAP